MLTAVVVVLNAEVVAPAGIVTAAGTVTAALLLERATTSPPAGAPPLKVMVQASEAPPAIEAFAQERALRPAAPVPLILTTVLACDALLEMVSAPVKELAWSALNCSVRVAVWPGLSVVGVVKPVAENRDPVTVRLETVTGALPVEESVMVCLAVCPTVTLPKLTLFELTVSVPDPPFSRIEKAAEAPPEVAVNATV